MSDDDGLHRFLSQAAGHRLLSAHEEKSLGRRVQSGDVSARNELVLCNIRLVVSVARYYRNRGLPMSDVVQEGIKGLHRAAEKFDPERGIRFSTYATLWIKQAIQRGISSSGSAIRLPSSVAATRAKVRSAQSKYPDADHVFLADLLDLDVKEVERVLDAAEVVTSLDREITTDEHTHSLLDSMADPNAEDPYDLVDDDLTAVLLSVLTTMDRDGARGKMRRRVIELNFGLTGKPPMPVKAIALKLNKSDNNVKTLREEGLRYLREALEPHR